MEKRFKRSAAKWALIISACLLVAAFIVGVCLQTFGTGKAKPSEWFDSGKQEELTVGGGMVLPDNEKPTQGGNGISLYSAEIPVEAYAENGVSEDAENAYTVTATVSPDNDAQNTVVLWALTWKDPSSAWATGKELSDYITATPNGEGVAESKTVTVVCLQSFGEPVLLTAKCKYDETVTVSVQIDYAARLQLVTYEAVNMTDAMENAYTLNWGGTTNVPFETGDMEQVITLCPQNVVFKIASDFTIEDTYSVTLKQEEGFTESAGTPWLMIDTDIFSLDLPVSDLGEVPIRKNLNTETIELRPNYPDGTSELYKLSFNGIGKHLTRVSYPAVNTSTLYTCYQSNLTVLRSELEYWISTGNRGNFHFSDLILEVSNAHATYEYRTKINVTKVLNCTTLSGVTIDQSNLIF